MTTRSKLTLGTIVFFTLCGAISQTASAQLTREQALGETRSVFAIAIDAELSRFAIVTGTEDDTIGQLRKALQPSIEKMEKNRGARTKARFSTGELTNDVPVAIVDAASKLGIKSEALDKYKADESQRRQFRHSALVASLISKVHSAVGLRADQIPKLRGLGETLAKQDKLPVLVMPESLSAGVKEEIKKLLNDSQVEFFRKNIANSGLGRAVRLGRVRPDRETRSKELRDKLQSLADARVLWLTSEFDLTSQQNRKLQLAVKGSLSRIIEERLGAEDKFDADWKKNGRPSLNTEAGQLMRADPASLLFRNGRFRKFAMSVLDDDQTRAYNAFEKQMLKLQQELLGNVFTIAIVRDMPLTAPELFSIRDVVLKHLPPPDLSQAGIDPKPYGKILGLPTEELLVGILPANRPAMTRHLKALRNEWESQFGGR